MTPAAQPEDPQERQATTIERDYRILAEWKRGVKLRSAKEETPSLDKVIKEHVINGIRPEAHAQVTSEVARHLAVLQDAFVVTYDDTRAELQNTGETLDVLLGRASEQVVHTQNM